jgi:hypothetical protein
LITARKPVRAGTPEKEYTAMFGNAIAGIVVIIFSTIVIGYSSYLANK